MIIENLRTIWDDHAKAVYAYLLHLTRNEADASDFLQDLFSRLARQPELLDKLHGEPRGFLLRLARNAVVDQARRHQARERVFEKINALRPAEFFEAEDPDHPLLRDALADALAHLPIEQRSVAHARLWKKQTLESISSELGISINTAASRYRYALDKMRERLRYLYEDLVPSAVQNPNPDMNQKPRNPFHRFDDPIIQPLEARRVPSATGAGFALPVLPAPEDHWDDAADHGHIEETSGHESHHDQEIEPLFDAHDSHFNDAHLASFLHFDTSKVQLPFSFDHVMQNLGKESPHAEPNSPDIVWAMDKLQAEFIETQHAPVVVTPVVDLHPTATSNELTSGVLTGNGGMTLSSLNLATSASVSSSFTASVNDNGVLTVVIANHESDPAVEPVPAADTVTDQHDSKVSTPETPSGSAEPHAQHTVAATHEAVVNPTTAAFTKEFALKPSVQAADFHEVQNLDPHPGIARPELISSLPHETAEALEPAALVHEHSLPEHALFSLHPETVANRVESQLSDHPAVVDQWVPVHDDSSEVMNFDSAIHATDSLEVRLEQHPLDIADTGAWTTPPLRGSAIAMAATGSLLLSGEEKSRKRDSSQ